MKKALKILFRVSVTFVLIAYLLSKIDLSSLFQSLSKINIYFFLSASFLYIVSSYISTLRWKLFIIPSTNHHSTITNHQTPSTISNYSLFSLYMIGCFFNTFLPGIMGGDFVKVLLMRKHLSIKEAVASVLVERYIGLMALLFLGFVFFCIFYEEMRKNWILYSVPASFIFFLLLTFGIFSFGKKSIFKGYSKTYFPIIKKNFFKALLYSFLVQIVVMISVYLIFIGLGISVKFYAIFIYLPVIIILTMLPISISGIGVREWGFFLFFGSSIGYENAVSASFLWFLSVALASLFGGIEYLRFKDFFDMKQK